MIKYHILKQIYPNKHIIRNVTQMDKKDISYNYVFTRKIPLLLKLAVKINMAIINHSPDFLLATLITENTFRRFVVLQQFL